MVAISSFITSLATSGGIFCVLMILFTILARMPANAVIYFPARILKGVEVPEQAKKYRGPWVWMVEAYKATEQEIIAIAGLDAAIYLNLFTAALKIMFFSSIFLLPVLLPLAATDHGIEQTRRKDPSIATNYSKLDNLAMSNIMERSKRIWAFLIGAYIVSFVIYWVLNQTYKHVVELRAGDMGDLNPEPEQFACLVRDIPKLTPDDESREEQVDEFFRKVHPDTYERCLIVTKLKKPSKTWKNIEKAKKKLAHAEAVYELSKTKANPEGVRPQNKTGKLGLYGSKVDSIDYWSKQIDDLPEPLEKEQEDSKENEQKGAAVIFFNSRRAAAEASQESHSQFADRWTVQPAPEPRALIWNNMHVGFYQRMIREPIIYFIVLCLILLYMIPIAFIATLTTLDNLTRYLPFLKSIVNIGSLKTIIQAYLPQVALLAFLALLPIVLKTLSRLEGIISLEKVERASCGKMYYFVVFNVFLGFTFFGTLLQSSDAIRTLTDAGNLGFSQIITLFGSSLPPNASYFITYVALKFFVGYGLELSRLLPLVKYHIMKRYKCKTEDEVRAAWAPGAFTYLPDIPNDLLVVTITISYAVIAPLIIPFAFAYFGIGWFVVRNQALNVYIPKYESRGRFWPHIHSRFLVGTFVFQITAIGYFGLKKFRYFFFLIPLPLLTLWFARITHLVYYPAFRHLSVAAASSEVSARPPLDTIVKAFTPSCLLPIDEENDVESGHRDKLDNSSLAQSSRRGSQLGSARVANDRPYDHRSSRSHEGYSPRDRSPGDSGKFSFGRNTTEKYDAEKF